MINTLIYVVSYIEFYKNERNEILLRRDKRGKSDNRLHYIIT